MVPGKRQCRVKSDCPSNQCCVKFETEEGYDTSCKDIAEKGDSCLVTDDNDPIAIING